MSFETLSFLSHLVHWKAYVIIFWQMWKDILGFELRSARIVCIKFIPSAKKIHFFNQMNRVSWSKVHKFILMNLWFSQLYILRNIYWGILRNILRNILFIEEYFTRVSMHSCINWCRKILSNVSIKINCIFIGIVLEFTHVEATYIWLLIFNKKNQLSKLITFFGKVENIYISFSILDIMR